MQLKHTQVSEIQSQENIQENLKEYSASIGEMVTQAKNFKIQHRSDVNKALKFAAEARKLGQRIDSIKKEITEPARKFTASINDISKSFIEKLDEIEGFMMLKIDAWKDLMRDKQEIYDMMESDVVLEKTDHLRYDGIVAYEKSQYRFEVIDIEKVPHHYLKVDEKQVELMLKAGVTGIPGLKVWEEKKTILKSR